MFIKNKKLKSIFFLFFALCQIIFLRNARYSYKRVSAKSITKIKYRKALKFIYHIELMVAHTHICLIEMTFKVSIHIQY